MNYNSKNYIITQSAKNLAVSIDTVSSLLRLDYDYDRNEIATAIRHCTAQVEATNGYALIHKTIVVTHANNRIAIPLTPIYKICGVRKMDLKTSVRTDITPQQYECEVNSYGSYVRILPSALSEEEQIAMGIAQSTGKKRYCKESRIQFEVEYEAGMPSTDTGEDVASDKVPEVFKTKVINLVLQHLKDKCAHSITNTNDQIESYPQHFGGKFFATGL